MFVVNQRKIYYIISGVLVATSILSLLVLGLNFGIDFKGGSILELTYQNRPAVEDIRTKVAAQNLGETTVQPTGNNGVIIRLKNLAENERQALVSSLTAEGGAQVERFDSVGPILGKELKSKAILSVVLVMLAIVLFITFAFRKVSEPVSSWKYGFVAIVALLHDVIVPVGFFSLFGHFYGFEIDTLFVTAILVVLGFSVHDTIVVFDRTRENLKNRKEDEKFEEIVGASISQTFTRSITTSVTVLLSLIALYIFGAEATRDFSLVMFVGILAGIYSSIFLASPLLVTLEKMQKPKKEINK
jgi:preprotein translocase subunit SecF